MNGWPEIRARSFEGMFDRPAAIENLLSRKEQEQLRSIATMLDCRRGNPIYSEGEDARFVYFVDDGIVRISHCSENGQRQILAFAVSGDLFGLPDGGQYVNTAEPVSAARIYRFPWQRMREMMRAEPRLQLNLLTKMLYDFSQAQSRIMNLGRQSTCQRLAAFILDLLLVPEFFDQERSRLKLPVNRFDLADYLGTAPESAARAFAKLESQGLVRRVTSRTIEILDIEGLQSLQRGPRRGHRDGFSERTSSALQEQHA